MVNHKHPKEPKLFTVTDCLHECSEHVNAESVCASHVFTHCVIGLQCKLIIPSITCYVAPAQSLSDVMCFGIRLRVLHFFPNLTASLAKSNIKPLAVCFCCFVSVLVVYVFV